MKGIIVDTNILLAIEEVGLDLFGELEHNFPYPLFVVEGTLKELQKIKLTQRAKFRIAAQVALQLLKAKNVKVLVDEGHVDNILAEYSRQGYLVLTADQELKKRLRKPYLTVRQKKKIVMVE